NHARSLMIERLAPRITSAPMLTRLPDGSVMRCDFADFVQRQIYFGGLFEPIESYLFLKMIAPGMTVFDVGANCGQYTVLAARAVGAIGTVHSFEPMAATFVTLDQNVCLNRFENVTINQAALWNEATNLSLGNEPGEQVRSGRWSAGFAAADPSAVSVRALRLDDYVREHGITRIDLIKMDIEGAEPFMLQGARESLDRFRPAFLMEVNRAALARLGSTPERLWEEFSTRGYRAFEIGQSPRRSGPVSDFRGIKFGNVILHVNDLPAEITSGWDRRPVKRWACSGW
ncbi:MAG: FkbM family methyltransferase, partial [Candidatus Binataceae bacterium]